LRQVHEEFATNKNHMFFGRANLSVSTNHPVSPLTEMADAANPESRRAAALAVSPLLVVQEQAKTKGISKESIDRKAEYWDDCLKESGSGVNAPINSTQL
jgi:hypothetical protein